MSTAQINNLIIGTYTDGAFHGELFKYGFCCFILILFCSVLQYRIIS